MPVASNKVPLLIVIHIACLLNVITGDPDRAAVRKSS
jgi:hypothetical protein